MTFNNDLRPPHMGSVGHSLIMLKRMTRCAGPVLAAGGEEAEFRALGGAGVIMSYEKTRAQTGALGTRQRRRRRYRLTKAGDACLRIRRGSRRRFLRGSRRHYSQGR